MKIKKKVKDFNKRIIHILSRSDMLILPGQLAFFLLLAIVPTITIIAYAASLFNVSIDFISNFMIKAFGSNVKELIIPIITEIKLTPGFLIPFCIALYTSSGGSSSIIVTSNQLYGFENTRFMKRKIKGLIMILILVILIVFLLLIPGFGDKFIELIKYVNMNNTVTNSIIFMINLSKGPISWLIIFMLIKIIYTMAPDGTIKSSYTTKGSLFTTFGFTIITSIYSFYVTHFSHYDILYGGLSHFVILMIWLYLISYIIIIGIAINAEEYQKRQKLAQ